MWCVYVFFRQVQRWKCDDETYTVGSGLKLLMIWLVSVAEKTDLLYGIQTVGGQLSSHLSLPSAYLAAPVFENLATNFFIVFLLKSFLNILGLTLEMDYYCILTNNIFPRWCYLRLSSPGRGRAVRRGLSAYGSDTSSPSCHNLCYFSCRPCIFVPQLLLHHLPLSVCSTWSQDTVALIRKVG